jgi:hypothetical protein
MLNLAGDLSVGERLGSYQREVFWGSEFCPNLTSRFGAASRQSFDLDQRHSSKFFDAAQGYAAPEGDGDSFNGNTVSLATDLKAPNWRLPV